MARGLDEMSVAVPLRRLDEKAPSLSGPAGRIDRIVNYIVNKFHTETGDRLQLDRRPGWHSATTTLFDPYGANGAAGSLPKADCNGKLGEANFIVGEDAIPYVYSPAAGAWGKFYNETVLTNKVSQSLVKMDSSVIKCPDSASIGSSHCYVWQDSATGFPWVAILDDEGAVIREPFFISGQVCRVKVRADGVNFWVVREIATTGVLEAIVYSPTTGKLVANTTSFRGLDAFTDPFDIICDATVGPGVFIARGHVATGVNTIALTHLTIPSGSIVVVSDALGSFTGSDPPPANGIGFLEPALNGFLYISRTSDSGGNRHVIAFKSDLIAGLFVQYNTIQVTDPLVNICNVTGYVDVAAGKVHCAATILPGGGSPPTPNTMINIRTVFGYGTASLDNQAPFTRRSVGLASRKLVIGEIPCVMSYYTSVETVVSEISGAVAQGSPTFFLLRADTGAVIGRLFPGQAAGNALWLNWSGTALPPDGFQLPSARASGDGVAIALPITGEQNVTRVRTNDGPFADVFSSSVGIRNIEFSAESGTCVEGQNETLIPGPLPRSFDGISFGAAGAELAPEQPTITAVGSGPFQSGDKRSYVIVYERFNRSGNKVRSPSSVSIEWNGATASSGAQLVIPTLRATSYGDWIISIYRTIFVSSTQGLTHYKITSDQSPIHNDTTSDTVTFTDAVDDATAQLNEILYGGSGAVPTALGGGDGQEVDHDCAPAFNSGTVFGDRAFLVGYDGGVWFSLPGSAGNSLAFSSLFKMTIPTQDRPTAIDAIDTRLIMLCSRSIWFNNQANYLDATGAGDVPTPIQLPISNGCTGAEFAYRDGIIYASSAGGFYLLTRDLDSQYIGGAIEDDVNANLPILDIRADDAQRIYAVLSNGNLAVFDIVSASWYYWMLPAGPAGELLTTVGGKIGVYCGNGALKVSTPGAYDDDGSVIVSEVGIADISTAGLPGCQMIWQVILMGVSFSEHTLDVDFTPDGLVNEIEIFGPIDPMDFGVAPGEEYRSWVEPARMETSSFRLDITDTPTTPGRGLSLQQLGLSVGIIPGTRKPSTGRIASPRS